MKLDNILVNFSEIMGEWSNLSKTARWIVLDNLAHVDQSYYFSAIVCDINMENTLIDSMHDTHNQLL